MRVTGEGFMLGRSLSLERCGIQRCAYPALDLVQHKRFAADGKIIKIQQHHTGWRIGMRERNTITRPTRQPNAVRPHESET